MYISGVHLRRLFSIKTIICSLFSPFKRAEVVQGLGLKCCCPL